MDPDINKWMNKQQNTNYCSNCGGSGTVHVGVSGNPKLDFETCRFCKGTGQPTIQRFKASAVKRSKQIHILEFETMYNKKDIQQAQVAGSTEPFKLKTVMK